MGKYLNYLFNSSLSLEFRNLTNVEQYQCTSFCSRYEEGQTRHTYIHTYINKSPLSSRAPKIVCNKEVCI